MIEHLRRSARRTQLKVLHAGSGDDFDACQLCELQNEYPDRRACAPDNDGLARWFPYMERRERQSKALTYRRTETDDCGVEGYWQDARFGERNARWYVGHCNCFGDGEELISSFASIRIDGTFH